MPCTARETLPDFWRVNTLQADPLTRDIKGVAVDNPDRATNFGLNRERS
jgi:hypothetical protein